MNKFVMVNGEKQLNPMRGLIYKNSKINFTDWIKSLQDHHRNVTVGKEMEALRISKDKEMDKLGNLHTFEDDEVAQIIISADTIDKMEKD